MTDTDMTYDEQVDAIARHFMTVAAWDDTANEHGRERNRRSARAALAVIGIDPPEAKWPTQEMIAAARNASGSNDPDDWWLPAFVAAWKVDPRRKIVEAAVTLRDQCKRDGFGQDAQWRRRLNNAVDEAGL